jgi:hypothetical protein
VSSKRAVEEIEPLTLLPLELAVSVAALAVVTAASRQRVRSSTELRRLGANTTSFNVPPGMQRDAAEAFQALIASGAQSRTNR